MGHPVVLIVSFAEDAHLDLVTPHLDRIGAHWELLATDRLGRDCHVTLQTGQGSVASLSFTTQSGWVGSGEDVGAVWNRRRLVDSSTTGGGLPDPLADQYVREQRTHLLDNLICLSSARWINSPIALRRARPKIQQLIRARVHDLAVPRTLCSDDPAAVRGFASTVGSDVITKVVSPGTPLVADGQRQYIVFTQPFEQPVVSDAHISAAPAIYQERVRKAFDARVVVVGEELFGCLIASQSSQKTSLDWRRYEYPHVQHSPVDVPTDVASALQALHAEYGLCYSASDFAITPEGEWVFLELNPNGQWGWLEEEARLPIGEALARELTDAAAQD
jgi:glutathione synthase/RimK-type ligase-like ATP-grasp enzyme